MQKTNVFNNAEKDEKMSVLGDGENSNTLMKKRGRPRKVLNSTRTAASKDHQPHIIPKANTGVLKENTPEASGDKSATEGKRPRGRPRIHPVEENKVKKPRGRPKKEQSSLAFAGRQLLHNVRRDAKEPESAQPPKRGPGRPRKSVMTEQGSDGTSAIKRKPGRPRKFPEASVSLSSAKTKRGPGRPRKLDVSSSKEGTPTSLSSSEASTAASNEERRYQAVKILTANADDVETPKAAIRQVEGPPAKEQNSPANNGAAEKPNIFQNSNLFRARRQRSNSSHGIVEPMTAGERLTRSAGDLVENRRLEDTPNKRPRFHSDAIRKTDVEKRSVRGEILLLGNPTVHTEPHSKTSMEAQELRSSIEPSSDVTNVTESPRSPIDLTFSAGTQALGARSSSSTSNEGMVDVEHSVKDKVQLDGSENKSNVHSTKKKRRLKKTGAVLLDEDLLKEDPNMADKPTQSDVFNKSLVLDFGRNHPSSSRPKSKDDNTLPRNNILDDSYDVFEFSNHGNSGFIIPMDAFKSPRKKKTITAAETDRKANGILGVLTSTAQTLQNISRTPRHISLGQRKNVLDDIDTNIEFSEDESDYSSSASTPIQSPRRSPNLRPLQHMHNIMTTVDGEGWEAPQRVITPTSNYASSSPRRTSNSMTGAQVKNSTDKQPMIQKLSADKNILQLDNFQLDDHGTPESSAVIGTNQRKVSDDIDIPSPNERLPVWKCLQSSSFSSLDKDRKMLSKFLHGLLRYVNINEADLSNDIDGNLNYFIQQMPEKELDMKFSEWLYYKVEALKDEYVKDVERKKEILLERFRVSEKMVRNITDSKSLLELASRFGINYN